MCITIFLFFFRLFTFYIIVVFDTDFDLNVVLGFTLLSRGIHYGLGDGRWGKKKKCWGNIKRGMVKRGILHQKWVKMQKIAFFIFRDRGCMIEIHNIYPWHPLKDSENAS